MNNPISNSGQWHVSKKFPGVFFLLAVALVVGGCGTSQSPVIDWELKREGGYAVMSIGELTVVFENIPMKGGNQLLAAQFFHVPAPGERREPLSGGRSVNELTIKEWWADGVNTISFNDYSFQLIEDASKLKFGDKTFDIQGVARTLVVAKDGTVKEQGE